MNEQSYETLRGNIKKMTDAYLKVCDEKKELEKQLTRKTNLHNKTAKRLTALRKENRDAQRLVSYFENTCVPTLKKERNNFLNRVGDLKKENDELTQNLADSRMVADGWKNQFEILEDKAKSTEEAKAENWELAVKYWRTRYHQTEELLNSKLQMQHKTAARLRVARAMQKHQSDQKVFFTRLNRAAGNRIYRLEKELEVERNRVAQLPATEEAVLLNIKLVQSLGEELEMERDRLADAVAQIKRLESENEDGKNFKRLESSYDDLFERHKEAVAQLEHEESLKSYSDAYIKDLELTQCHLRQEVQNYKEDVLHVVRVSRKG